MKEENEINKGGGVKKFRYVGPTKKETLPQQWSQEPSNINGFSFGKPKSSSLDLDSVWSIKRNVTVSQTSLQSRGMNNFNRNDATNLGNTFYSRHKTVVPKSVQPSESKSHKPKMWMRGSAHSVSNASSSPQNDPMKDADDDEFDFDLLSPSTNKWQSQTHGQRNSLKNSTSAPKKTFGGGGNRYSDKYNSSSYFDF
uniref:Uncharacterized protein LOC100187089 n=1 Tax=Phallusia mammillata TaxID=59560 RepID=A0A6F9DJ85_9ASCI|nr:uncharacterized protein LOC100187089 [Phallusia mammillata]